LIIGLSVVVSVGVVVVVISIGYYLALFFFTNLFIDKIKCLIQHRGGEIGSHLSFGARVKKRCRCNGGSREKLIETGVESLAE
jgi:hypothetical protein